MKLLFNLITIRPFFLSLAVFQLFWAGLASGESSNSKSFDSKSFEMSLGVSHFLSGKSELAYPTLEKVWKNVQSSLDAKLAAALILSYASNDYLKQNPRHIYAAYFLNQKTSPPKEIQPSLLRIAGEGYFEAHEFELSRTFFEALANDSDIFNRAYANDQLSWIFLNLKKPLEAYVLLTRYLQKEGHLLEKQDSGTFHSLVKDAGRAFAESIETRELSPDLEVTSELSFYESHFISFIDGFSAGLKRTSSLEKVEKLGQILLRTSLGQKICTIYLENEDRSGAHSSKDVPIWFLILEMKIHKSIENKNFVEARTLLQKLIPISQEVAQEVTRDEHFSSLWEYYWTSIDTSLQSSETSTVQTWFQLLPHAQLSPLRKMRALGILYTYGNIPQIWQHWSDYSEIAHQHPEFLSAFYNQTLELLKPEKVQKEKIQPVTIQIDSLLKFQDGAVLVRIHQNDPRLTRQDLELVMQRQSPLYSDLKNLETLTQIHLRMPKNKIKIHSRFLKSVTQRLQIFQEEEQLISETQWSQPFALAKAQDLLIQDGQQIIDELTSLRLSFQDQEFVEVFQEIEEIENGIRKRMGQSQENQGNPR